MLLIYTLFKKNLDKHNLLPIPGPWRDFYEPPAYGLASTHLLAEAVGVAGLGDDASGADRPIHLHHPWRSLHSPTSQALMAPM